MITNDIDFGFYLMLIVPFFLGILVSILVINVESCKNDKCYGYCLAEGYVGGEYKKDSVCYCYVEEGMGN